MRSRRMEERAADILAIWEERRDITLGELRLALADKGMDVSVAGLHRFFVRRGLTRKKRMARPVCSTHPVSPALSGGKRGAEAALSA